MAFSRTLNAWGVLAAIALSFAPFSWGAEFAGGTGTPNDPYQIATAQQLVSLGSDPNLLNKHFVLIADIDLDPNLPGGRVFTQAVIPGEVHSTRHGDIVHRQITTLDGSFDGNGHTIRNMVIDAVGDRDVGLFEIVGASGRIQNLSLENVLTEGESIAGGLAAYNTGIVLGCHVWGRVSGRSAGGLVGHNDWGIIAMSHVAGVVSGGGNCGGLAGENFNGTIANCYSDARVYVEHGCHYLGGLVGQNFGSIRNCYATGPVSAGDDSGFLGGLVGSNQAGITNCYATGSVLSGSRTEYVGGFVGDNSSGSIANCYAAGRVSAGVGSKYVGGFLGRATSRDDISHCFWDMEASGTIESDGGSALATSEMQTIGRYLVEGWDWVGERDNGTADLWMVPETGGYPRLAVFTETHVPVLRGSGTRDDPYRIATAEDLGAISHYDPSAYYKLDADIDMSGIVWTTAPVAGFDGTLEGAGHTISNLTIRGGGSLGLFGILGTRAEIMAIAIKDADLAGIGRTRHLGGLAAENLGSITACRAAGIVSGGQGAGGLVGNNRGGIVECHASVEISGGESDCGGLVGVNDGTITVCYAVGRIFGATNAGQLGGLVGHNEAAGRIINCYARGDVSGGEGSQRLGGLVGYNRGTMTNCYASGDISAGKGSRDLGGLIGSGSLVVRPTGGLGFPVRPTCYFLRPVENIMLTNSLGLALWEEDMKKQSSFVGWDFVNVWTLCEGRDYPRLRWEAVECQP
jgi:hypothetical protein